MSSLSLPPYAADQPAARVDTCLREALAACDRARQCAVLWFAEVQRRALYRDLGHASLQLYATQALGFSDNRFRQFKRLADDLERLPALRDAVAAGELGWTKAQQVARVASPATQSAWVARAKTAGRRELAQEVRAASAGPSSPATDAPARADRSRHTISLQLDAWQLARFEALLGQVRRRRLVPPGADRAEVVLAALAVLAAGGDAHTGDDDATNAVHPPVQAMSGVAATVAGGRRGRPRGAPPVQVVVQRCPDCEAAAIATSRGEIALPPARVEALACDARVRRAGGPNRATVPPRLRAAVLARDRHRCATPGCGAAQFLEVHHVVPRSAGGANEAANLVTLCSRCHGFAHEHRLRAPAHAPLAAPAPAC